MKTPISFATLILSIWLLLPVGLWGQGLPGITPVPADIEGQLDGAGRARIQWRAVSGHGSQDGLIIKPSVNYDEYVPHFGVDQTNWQLGDPSEIRRVSDGTHTQHLSSYGADIIFFDQNSGPDSEDDIFTLTEFTHTPLPYWPSTVGGEGEKAKFDQIHYFSAEPNHGRADMIDLSPLGVTHPDQLIWFPGENGYQYSYLMIDDNDGDQTDVAAAILIRADRTYGAFSLTKNIIYAEGQTTYTVYRRAVGSSQYQPIAAGLTDTVFVDGDILPSGQSFEYVVTATAMFGESRKASGTIVSIPGSLPVEWLSFEATALPSGFVQLDWATAQEESSERFVVERSLDGRSFIQLGSVEAAGHATETRHYQFLDEGLTADQAYYRLRQVDLNGAFHYSELREVSTIAAQAVPQLSLYPNPSQGEITLTGLLPGEDYRLQVVDAKGRTLQQWEKLEPRQGSLHLSVQTLPSGLYQVLVQNSNRSYLLVLPLLRV